MTSGGLILAAALWGMGVIAGICIDSPVGVALVISAAAIWVGAWTWVGHWSAYEASRDAQWQELRARVQESAYKRQGRHVAFSGTERRRP